MEHISPNAKQRALVRTQNDHQLSVGRTHGVPIITRSQRDHQLSVGSQRDHRQSAIFTRLQTKSNHEITLKEYTGLLGTRVITKNRTLIPSRSTIISRTVISIAVKNGHINILNEAAQHNILPTIEDMDLAHEIGQMDVLEWGKLQTPKILPSRHIRLLDSTQKSRNIWGASSKQHSTLLPII